MVTIRLRLASCVLAASLVSGCTINVQSGTGPATHKRPPPPPPPVVRPRTPARPDPTPARRTQPTPTRRPPASSAPRIKTPIAFGNGTAGAFQGLAYVIPSNTQQMPRVDSLVPFATVYTDSFDIRPQEFSSGFPGALLQTDWFAIRYEGGFKVPSSGVWRFRLTADDGAILYVDDRRVVSNDGVHTARSADGEAELAAGPHRLRLDYFQAGTSRVALILLVGKNDKLAPLVGTR
jgi:hypothetical protein